MIDIPQKIFCFGIGYSARCLLDTLKRQGWQVAGTCRSEAKRSELSAQGIETHCFSPDEGVIPDPSVLEGVTHILSSIAPTREGDPVLASFQDSIEWRMLHWVGYLSTTGVYGDHGGSWVDESTPLLAGDDRLLRRINAEKQWLGLPLAAHIFRLSGIYGPGRSAIDQVRDGDARRIYKQGQYFSRIHIEDIARIISASMRRPMQGEIFNVCDDEPAPSHEVIQYASLLLGMQPPPLMAFEDAELSDMARSFYMNNRRMRNTKVKQKLNYTFIYPTYREGLLMILESTRGAA